jgi:hypothetical protein
MSLEDKLTENKEIESGENTTATGLTFTTDIQKQTHSTDILQLLDTQNQDTNMKSTTALANNRVVDVRNTGEGKGQKRGGTRSGPNRSTEGAQAQSMQGSTVPFSGTGNISGSGY